MEEGTRTKHPKGTKKIQESDTGYEWEAGDLSSVCPRKVDKEKATE